MVSNDRADAASDREAYMANSLRAGDCQIAPN